jgi:hypothetical protein
LANEFAVEQVAGRVQELEHRGLERAGARRVRLPTMTKRSLSILPCATCSRPRSVNDNYMYL